MPKAKLKLSKEEAGKVPAAHSLAGTTTSEAFQVGDVFHLTVSGRSTEQLIDFGRSLGAMTDKDIEAYNVRVKKAQELKAARDAKAGKK